MIKRLMARSTGGAHLRHLLFRFHWTVKRQPLSHVRQSRSVINSFVRRQSTYILESCRQKSISCSLYYREHRDPQAAAFEQQVLNAIDELYTAHPHLGRHGMTDALAQERRLHVNPKRVRRLMKTLGLEAVYPRPRRNTSQASKEHLKFSLSPCAGSRDALPFATS